MNPFKILRKISLPKFSLLFSGLVAMMTLSAQRPVITHNIGTGSLTIASAQFGNDYIITGTTTANLVTVQTGYQGTITLRNLNITSNTQSCITIQGQYNQSNLNPVTKVNIVLDGDNNIQYTNALYCAIQVDQGAQIQISAIDPNDDASGSLFANSSPYVKGTPITLDPPAPYQWTQQPMGGAGIGAPQSVMQGTATINCDLTKEPYTSGCTSSTAGGNIIITSGTIFAHGGHGAGIGGGYQTYYDGIIIITGGKVQSYAEAHAAGIGSGCPCGAGVDNCYGPNSVIIVLPPAEIKAAGASNNSPYWWRYETAFALAGMANIIYLNDPAKPLNTVRTEDYEPNATIYLDLTQIPGLVSMFNTLGINLNLTKVKVGKTDASGLFTIHARIEQNVTFFTDASSTNPLHPGRPYMPVTTTILTATNVVLPLLNINISLTDYPSTPLTEGYSATQARQNAQCTKIEYNDPLPMTGVTFSMQGGTNFSSLIFLASDSTTVIPAPTTLTAGSVFYVIEPLNTGKTINIYHDVLQILGTYNAVALPGPIRRVIEQRVVLDDSQTNTYIKVTASPNQFEVKYPAANVVNLTLNINHTGLSFPYNSADVTAKYLITTEPNFDTVLAANPLYTWSSLNIPAAEGVDQVTPVDFSSLPSGTYYIHWYVVSGLVMAHSLTVINPPRLYGGFGPYRIIDIIANNEDVYVFECGTRLIDVLANDVFTGSGTPLLQIVTPPAPLYGTASVVGNKVQYTDTPPCDGGKIDMFKYGIGINNILYDTATVRVGILPVPKPLLKDSCSFAPKLEASRQYAGAVYLWEYSADGTGGWTTVGTTAVIPFTETGFYRLTTTINGLAAVGSAKIKVIKTTLKGGVWYETSIE